MDAIDRACAAVAKRCPRGPAPILVVAVVSSLGLGGCGVVYDRLGGAFSGPPDDLMFSISPGARDLLLEAMDGIEGDRFVDYHTHHLSLAIHPRWLSWWHPVKRARTMVFLSAAGVEIGDGLEERYIDRLVALATRLPKAGRLYLYALDRYYRPDGTPEPDRTPIHVSNEDVMEAAARHPDVLVPVISVHPYRPDALEELERWAGRGARHLKWLPNTMGINPADPRLEPFYRKMLALDIVLLSHTGDERAVETACPQLGNPLLLRRPLEMGLTVVALHAASDGVSLDFESPSHDEAKSEDLLLRMLDDPRYRGRLFADISCIAFRHHLDEPLLTFLEREDLQERLVYGSDYPFCAVRAATRTSQLVAGGFLTAEEGKHLDEIYAYNPLAFDLALKRTVRHPKTGRKLSPAIFGGRAALDRPAGARAATPDTRP